MGWEEEEKGWEGEGGEVEGREKDGPKLLLNQDSSEPCYATADADPHYCTTDLRRWQERCDTKWIRFPSNWTPGRISTPACTGGILSKDNVVAVIDSRSGWYLWGGEPVCKHVSSQRYEQPRTRLKFGEHCFACAGPAAWNSLPSSVQELTDTAASKHQLKSVLFQRCYSSST